MSLSGPLPISVGEDAGPPPASERPERGSPRRFAVAPGGDDDHLALAARALETGVVVLGGLLQLALVWSL